MTSTCDTCTYLHRSDDENGQCRRHAPILFGTYKGASFPWVKTLEDWCGEYSINIQPKGAYETRTFIKPTPYRKEPTS